LTIRSNRILWVRLLSPPPISRICAARRLPSTYLSDPIAIPRSARRSEFRNSFDMLTKRFLRIRSKSYLNFLILAMLQKLDILICVLQDVARIL